MKKWNGPKKMEILNEIDLYLLHKVVVFNTYYTSRQVYYIQRTIDLIKSFDATPSSTRSAKYEKLLNENIQKCQRWCLKYNIPYMIQ